MAKAVWNGKVIAESNDTLMIENNHYFPPSSVNMEYLKPSDSTSVCHWKGNANYYNIEVNGETNPDAAWYYAKPKEGSSEKVASNNKGIGDFSNYIAFWKGVEITD